MPRQRIPLRILKARGSKWARGRPEEVTPDPVVDLRPPAWVSKAGKRWWRELAPELARLGALSTLDRLPLGLLVDAYARYTEARKLVEKRGPIAQTVDGAPYQDPAVGVMNKAWEQVLRASRQFGLTPASRTALTRAPGKKDQGEGEKAGFLRLGPRRDA